MEENVIDYLQDGTNISCVIEQLFEVMSTLQLGEILDVEIPEKPKTVKVSEITQRKLALLEIIENGIRHFNSIKVEDGDPVSLVISYQEGPFKCKQTILL